MSALVAQRTLQAEPWGETGPIDVRMAIHAGAAEARAGDYFGSPLNRVARLCGVAAGRQILVSQAAEALARDQLPPDVQLRDLGTHRLKDLTRPEPIYQLITADLPSVFPPLKTLSSYRTNLPAQPTIVIGHDAEVAAVRDALRRADVRLITLSGPGGIGKTRLALEVAAALLDDFPDGVWFVSLAPIADSSLVVATIAQVLGLQEVSGHSLIDRLKRYLREKALLLVLDNFEQVVSAAPLIAEMLTVAPTLKVLITSRSRLRLSGEREFVVPPLTLPDRKPLPPLERLTQYEAVQLFIERAQAAKTDFIVTSANAPAIADICARLDGLPLAIELAAARIKLFAPAALLARLTHRLTLLIDGPQDLPARQQTLRAAISWSYDLLDASEQILFARLAVFAGSCTIEAAETICDLTGDPDSTTVQVTIFEGLSALLDKSLLLQMEDPHGEPRFMMLETMREYALERLDARGERELLRQRHAVYFASLAEVANTQLDSAEQAAGLQQLDAEIDNMRAALTWLHASDSLRESGLQLAESLSSYWLWRGLYHEGRAWLSRMLAHTEQATSVRGHALRASGMLAWYQGEFAAATALMEASLALNQQLQDKLGIAWAGRWLAVAVAEQDDVERAKILFGESLALFRELGNVRGTAWALAGWGSVATRHDDLAHAHTLLSEGLALFRELNDRQGIALTLSFLGYIAMRSNDLDRATALLTESLALSQELRYLSNSAWALASLGNVARRQHDDARAHVLIAESLAIFRELDERRGIAITSATLGRLEHEDGAYERAAALLTESVAICRELGERRVIPGLLRNLGAAARARGDHRQATAAFAESLTLARSLNDQSGIVASLEQIAEVLIQTGASERAARLFGAAEVLRDVSGQPREPKPDQTYAQAIATLRSQLGATTFAAAWTAGRALTLEQAMTEALEQDGGSHD